MTSEQSEMHLGEVQLGVGGVDTHLAALRLEKDSLSAVGSSGHLSEHARRFLRALGGCTVSGSRDDFQGIALKKKHKRTQVVVTVKYS